MGLPASKRASHYTFEIDCQGAECSHFEPRWASYDMIITEGNTLEELLDNASVFVIDQDGGELGELSADKDWMIELITEKYIQSLEEGHANEHSIVI